MFSCFNCGEPLNPSSLICKKCGFGPDIEFMKTCPNLKDEECLITEEKCSFEGEVYQECPIKNNAEKESF